MDQIMMCRTFLCKNKDCGKPLTIPLDMLHREAVNPADPPNVAREVILKCYFCSHLRTYSLDTRSSDRYGEDKLFPLSGCDNVMRLYGPGLNCEQKRTCDSHPPLLETFPAYLVNDLDWREANAGKKWISEGLKCINGHPILIPQAS